MMGMLIESSTDEGDAVWEPFGGLFSASLSAVRNGRIAYGAEIDGRYYDAGMRRFDEGMREAVQLALF